MGLTKTRDAFKSFAQFCLIALFIGSAAHALYSESTEKDIFTEIQQGHLKGIRELVRVNQGVLNERNTNQDTPLHAAVQGESLSIVRLLIKSGVDSNIQNRQENTPLHLAVEKKNLDLVQLLVHSGANPNIRNFRGRIPALMAIVLKSGEEIIRFLIENGSDLNTEDNYGSTLLARAAERRYPAIVDLLLDRKIKIPTDENRLWTLLYRAVQIDHIRLFRLILKGNPKIEGALKSEAKGLVLAAVQQGSEKMLDIFLERKFSLDVVNRYGNGAIHLAAGQGNIRIVKRLLENGLSINRKNLLGKTPLHIAHDKDNKALAAFLIRQGADPTEYRFPELKGDYFGQPLPGDRAVVFAPGIVSVEGLEHSPPVFSKDGNEMFWASEFATYILHSKRINGRWSEPSKAVFNSGFGDGEPIFSTDNNRLFFLSLRSLDGTKKDERERLWYVDRKDDSWSQAVCLGPQANQNPMHWTISIDDQDSLYFTSTRGNGFGKHDIFRIRLKNGSYLAPENLGPRINTAATETTPYIDPRRRYLICARIGHIEGIGGIDLFIHFKQKNGEWGKALNLGKTINTKGNELCPVITPDGKYLFFIRNADIYWVDASIIQRLRESRTQ